ncbi:MAG: hypothetical protein KDD35_07970, partial [Bdellovibrionales bacterium]|nr:hypothetical protein [Bdellovibrionales bacterium]
MNTTRMMVLVSFFFCLLLQAKAPAQTPKGLPSPPPSDDANSDSQANTSTPTETPSPDEKDPKKKAFAYANPEDITTENFPDLIESFDYPNAEISDVIK